jgi:hypothetical protein
MSIDKRSTEDRARISVAIPKLVRIARIRLNFEPRRGARLNSSERRGELLRGYLQGLGNRDRNVPVAIQDMARSEHRQPDDVASAGRVADDVALWRLLPLTCLGRANVQVEHIVRAIPCLPAYAGSSSSSDFGSK